MAEGRLTRDGVSGARKAAKRAAKQNETQPSRFTAPLEGGRSVTVSGAGLTLENFIEVIEQLLSQARKVRSRGISLATFIKMLRDQAKGNP